jgi:aminoglycoside 3-N-acetyltransferase I
MTIQQLSTTDTDDFINLIKIFNEVFENDDPIPSEKYLGGLLSNPDFLVFVAIQDNQVVGGLTVYILHQYYNEKPQAYFYDVGVSPDYQRQGIGKSLIEAVNSYCQTKGFEASYVEAEMEDIDALEFYRRTKPSSELQAVHFTYLFE